MIRGARGIGKKIVNMITAVPDNNDICSFIFRDVMSAVAPLFPFREAISKRPTGPSQNLFLLSIGWINQERSVNSVIQIYNKEEPNGLIYETDEAGIEAENRYQGVIAIRSQKGNPQMSGQTSPGKNSFQCHYYRERL